MAVATAVVIWTSAAAPAAAQGVAAAPQAAAFCPARPFRWMDDCAALAGGTPRGLQRLRYLPLAEDGGAWLTLGGEARARVEALQDIDFGINGQPGYVQTAARLYLHADLRARAGPRAFVQLGLAQENGRKPGPRPQDEGELNLSQAFVEAPFRVGSARAAARLGRQELDLSGNRLLTVRDGVALRRTFDGAKVDLAWRGVRLALVAVRPTQLVDAPFANRPDRSERFVAVSLDLPPTATGGELNLFVLDREREGARLLRAEGRERRQSIGAHYVRPLGAWSFDAQGAWQTGRVAGRPIAAWGLALVADREIGGPYALAVGLDAFAASGDKAGSRAIETFDPVYPNTGSVSDAPLFYQTNYAYGGGSVSARVGGVVWGASAGLLARQSTEDAIYANGRPIGAPFGRQRPSGLLAQVSARAALGPNSEIYASLARAAALDGVAAVGGRDAFYGRLQLTTRF